MYSLTERGWFAALQPSVEVSEVYKAKLQKEFIFGKGKLVAGAGIEVGYAC